MGDLFDRAVHPLYAVMAFISALIVIILLISGMSNRKGIKSNHKMIFYWVILFCLQDGIWGLFASHTFRNDTALFVLSNVFHLFAMFSSFVWTLYFLSRIKTNISHYKIYTFFSGAAVLVQLVMLIFNMANRFMFYVDEDGWYQTTNYRSILFYLQFATYIFIGIVSLIGTAKAGQKDARVKLFAIFSVNLSPLLFGVFQLIYPDAPADSIGFSIACIIIELFLSKDFEEQVYSLEQMQEELNTALKSAESANNAKTSFLFSMSHDIRTPMNAILGFTRIAEKHIDDKERVLDSLNKIKVSGAQLMNLINEVLEMSRIESGKIEINNEPTDLSCALDEIDPMLNAAAISKSIEYSVSYRNIKDRYVWGDIIHLNRVLVNIISNAIKYTPSGGKVNVLVEQLSHPVNGMADYSFTVRDNGIGMSSEFKEHLFEEFSREQTSTVSKQEGTGLGLSIAQRITDLMGGKIDVESEVEKGSTFRLTLSLKTLSRKEFNKYFGKNELSASNDKTHNNSFVGMKALLVEDNELNREIATDILKELGIEITEAEDGTFAVDIIDKMYKKGIKEDYFDFILMDIQMPVMNGYDATKKIRALDDPYNVHIPIIAMTANAFTEDIKVAFECGMDTHLSKPINVDMLIEKLSELTGNK